jgi:hypothetical protein
VSVRGPAALAAALPYLIDAPLAGCVVLALIREDSSLGFTAHRAMPPMPVAASQEVLSSWAADVGRDIGAGVAALAVMPGERLAVALFLPPGSGCPPPWLGSAILAECPLGPEALDVLAVFDGRWRSLVCAEESCCPQAGLPIADNSDAMLVAAELVGAGLSVTTDAQAAHRERDLAARCAEVGSFLDALPYPRSISARRLLLRQVWPVVRTTPQDIPASMVACLAAAADRPGVRDALLLRMARASKRDPNFWKRQVDLWSEVVRTTPDDWGAGPACLLAVAHWAAGDVREALVAAETSLALQPGHRMAELVQQLLLQGNAPQEWFARMLRISEPDCLRFDRPRPAAGPSQGRKAAG